MSNNDVVNRDLSLMALDSIKLSLPILKWVQKKMKPDNKRFSDLIVTPRVVMSTAEVRHYPAQGRCKQQHASDVHLHIHFLVFVVL